MKTREKFLLHLPQITQYNDQISTLKNRYSEILNIPKKFQHVPEKIQRRMYNLLWYFTYFGVDEKNKEINSVFSENHIHAFMDSALWLEAHYHKKGTGEYLMRKRELGYDKKMAFMMNHFLQVVEMGIGSLDKLKKRNKLTENKEFQEIIKNPLVLASVSLLHDSTEDRKKLFEEITPEKLRGFLFEISQNHTLLSEEEIEKIIKSVQSLSYHNTSPSISDENKKQIEEIVSEIASEDTNIDKMVETLCITLLKENKDGEYIQPTLESISEWLENNQEISSSLSKKSFSTLQRRLLHVVKSIDFKRREDYIASKEKSLFLSLVKISDIFHNGCSEHNSESQRNKYTNHYIPFVCRFLKEYKLQIEDLLPTTRIYEAFKANPYLRKVFVDCAQETSRGGYAIVIPNIGEAKTAFNDFSKPPLAIKNKMERWGIQSKEVKNNVVDFCSKLKKTFTKTEKKAA